MSSQAALSKQARVQGIGLHSGIATTLTFKSAPKGEGVSFVRIDLPGRPVIKVSPVSLVMDRGISRCTVLEANGVRVATVEHVLAALSGLSIKDVTIEIDGEEVPGMDGSSREFTEALLAGGFAGQEDASSVYVIKTPLVVKQNGASVMVIPADGFSVSYHLDYEHPLLRDQNFQLTLSQDSFINEVSGARTFCLEAETQAIRSAGLGKGANSQNTLIMTDQGPLDNHMRFADECCRHKALDIIGDLYTLGVAIRGAVYGYKSGHALNRALVQRIHQQRTQHMTHQQKAQRIFDIDAIKKILPHRYPFLFVDKVIEVEKGIKAIGIKNVTANDGFFQGHFPQKPVMPGVIMVEAMAQTAGVMVLTSGIHDGKVALFMAIDEVKFRKVVSPGDQLVMDVEVIRDRERTAQVKGVARVDGEVVVEAVMIFSYVDSSYLLNQDTHG